MTGPADPAATPLTPALKAAIRTHYDGRCQYCGSPGATHVEHIIPKAKGGPDTLGNATLGCESCNLRKGVLDLDPMFLAVAHARATAAAARILSLCRPPRVLRPKPHIVQPPRAAGSASSSRPATLWGLVQLSDVAGILPSDPHDSLFLVGSGPRGEIALSAGHDARGQPLGLPYGPYARWILERASTALRRGRPAAVRLGPQIAGALERAGLAQKGWRERVADQALRLTCGIELHTEGTRTRGDIFVGIASEGGTPIELAISSELAASPWAWEINPSRA